ncbi:serine/threonine-protein kinase [Chloroflexota bacterium]
MLSCPEPGCGHLNRPSARFCESCGRSLRHERWLPLSSGHMMRGGAYRILEPLGRGGMGALYLAADTGAFDRTCVVKELLDYYDPTDPEEARKAQARFETEARLLAELSHPGIPRIYSFFSEGGRHYIVMEYIEGETLQQGVTHADHLGRSIPARPLPAEQVARHTVRVCEVLEYLADRPTPVIHHDIKPANLIVDGTSGDVRLVDFGTAQTRTAWATQARLGKGVTSAFGTQGYAAPEQFQGLSEPRSDVYALAATAYHLLTDDDPCDHPFQFSEIASLSEPLADAIARALRPEVRRRSGALELRQAMQAWLIPEDASQPFVFRGGAVAHTTEELIALCDQNWSDARLHLQEGDFDNWFRTRNRHDLAAKSRSARLEQDVDAALEAFLRRLNPRLPEPSLAVEPQTLSFGTVTRGAKVERSLTLRNDGRGYGQATFSASVPWISLDKTVAGCLAAREVDVQATLVAEILPLRRHHQAVIACTPSRGARVSIPVIAELNLFAEALQRLGAALASAGRFLGRGSKRGTAFWMRTLRSLIRSRYGPWVLVGETLVLALVLEALWWSWRTTPLGPTDIALAFVVAVPVALLIVCLLPALAFVVLGVVGEAVHTVKDRTRAS